MVRVNWNDDYEMDFGMSYVENGHWMLPSVGEVINTGFNPAMRNNRFKLPIDREVCR